MEARYGQLAHPAPDSLSLSFMFYFEIISKHGSNFNYLLSIHSFPSLENTNVIIKVQYTHKILWYNDKTW